jgi:hypothetical protein
VCGQGHFRERFQIQDVATRERFKLSECRFCGVGHIAPVPRDLSRYYRTDVGQAMKTRPSGVYQNLKNVLLETETRRIQKRFQRGQIVDIGCGIGDFSRLLHKKGYELFCADSAEEKPLLVRDSNIPYHRIDYGSYEITGLHPSNGRLAVLRHVLEHIVDPFSFLRKISADYGVDFLYVAVPNSSSLKARMLGIYNCHLEPPFHIWHFSKKSLFLLLEKTGFRVQDHGYDTIPSIVPSIYRYLRLKGISDKITRLLHPKGALATLSLPLDFLIPHDVLWVMAGRKALT